MIHNRFTNNKGCLDSNVEMEREVEHWNKRFKTDCKEFHGKVTDKNIERASCSYQHIEDVTARFDKETRTHNPSGHHSRKSVVDDVKALAEQLKSRRLFQQDNDGRSHLAFPSFPINLLGGMDAASLKEWMQRTIRHFEELNIYDKFAK